MNHLKEITHSIDTLFIENGFEQARIAQEHDFTEYRAVTYINNKRKISYTFEIKPNTSPLPKYIAYLTLTFHSPEKDKIEDIIYTSEIREKSEAKSLISEAMENLKKHLNNEI